jgi:hypothetical protein
MSGPDRADKLVGRAAFKYEADRALLDRALHVRLGVFGVAVVGSEYTSGTFRTSLTAVPRRGLFYAAKLAAGLLAAAAAALVTVTATFFAAQQALGPHRTSPGAPGTLQAAVGACLYLTLSCALAMGVTAILRSQARALGMMMPLLFLDSQGLGNVSGLKTVIDYLPDQAGAVIMHLSGPAGGRFSRPYGPWTGMAIMLAWAVAALAPNRQPASSLSAAGNYRQGNAGVTAGGAGKSAAGGPALDFALLFRGYPWMVRVLAVVPVRPGRGCRGR